MGLFNNSKKLPVGPSYPFMEQVESGELKVKFDSLKVKVNDGQVTITFCQNNFDIYAYTFDYDEDSSSEVSFDQLTGEVTLAKSKV